MKPLMARLVSSLLSVAAAYAMLQFTQRNGFFDLVDERRRTGMLPGSGQALKTDMGGGEIANEILTSMIVLFWPVVDGTAPGLSLSALNVAGGVASIWMLVVLESSRKDARFGVLFFPWIWGMVAQLFTFGAVVPIFFTLQLFASPVGCCPSVEDISVSTDELWLLPVSIVTGFLLPSIAVALPGPYVERLFSKQGAIAAWLFWPLGVSISHWILGTAARAFCPESRCRPQQVRTALRHVYAVAFVSAAVPHLMAWHVSLTAYALPDVFSPAIRSYLQPQNVFWSPMPWSAARPESIAQGCHWFLQWDYLAAAIPAVVWAVIRYRWAHAAHNIKVHPLSLAVKIVMLCLVSGLAGTAVELAWERDEVICEAARNAASARVERDDKGVSVSAGDL